MPFEIKNGVLRNYRKEPGVTEVVIPDGVTRIGDGAFRDCENLSSIRIPAGVTCIEEYTFHCCMNLTDVVIPEGVTSVGKLAFACCHELTMARMSSRSFH